MSGRLTAFVVGDPHEIPSIVWDRLPPSEKSRLNEQELRSRTYEAADWGRFRSEPESYRSTFSIGHCAGLRLSRIADARGTGFDIHEPGLDAFCVSVMERGASGVTQPGTPKASSTDQTTGVIFPARPSTRLVTSDDSVRLHLWVPGRLLGGALEVMLERPAGNALEFSPIDWSRGGGASVRRLVRHLFAEMDKPDALLTRGIGAGEFEDLFVQSLLLGLPHSYSERLGRQNATAAPGNVRRAEEFLRANAEEMVTIEKVAQAAGCSIRALQLAFRRFRNITPMGALHRIRLQQAREETAQSDGAQSVIEIAAKFGFTNPGRFAGQYKRAFGEHPSEALRRRALRL
jgi:AraC-like DNA-binding protein